MNENNAPGKSIFRDVFWRRRDSIKFLNLEKGITSRHAQRKLIMLTLDQAAVLNYKTITKV
jgi:hypothetical protein